MLQTAIKRGARMTGQSEKQDFEPSVLWTQTEARHAELMGQGSATPMVPERRCRARISPDAVTGIERIMEELKRNLMELAAVTKPTRTEGPTADAFADWYAELPDAMNVREFARRFSFDEKTVRNMVEVGELGCHRRKGCSVRVLKPQVREWVEANLGWFATGDGDNGGRGSSERDTARKWKARVAKRRAVNGARTRKRT